MTKEFSARWRACLWALAWLVLGPSSLPGLALPEEFRDTDLKTLLKQHADDRAVPPPKARRGADDAGQGFPDLVQAISAASSPADGGVYQPGDRLVLVVTVTNKGRGVSHAPQVQLDGDALLFDLIASQASLADIPAGGSRTARFDSGPLPANLPTRQYQVSPRVADQDGFSAPAVAALALATQPKAVAVAEALPLLQPVPVTNLNGTPHGAAVLVGIGQYSSPDAGDLKYAASDADVMAEYLVKMMGIPKANVWVIKDQQATKTRILATVRAQLKGKGFDPVVFYFSGHGIPDPDDPQSGDACIVPYDGDFQQGYGDTLIKLNDMTKLVEGTTTGRSLMMLDACFSGGAGGRRPRLLAAEHGIGIVPRMTAAKASILAATSGIQPSLDFDEQKHGFFTYFMLAGLQRSADLNHDGKVTLEEAYAWAKQRIGEKTGGRQVPELKNPTDLVLSRWR